MTSSPSYVCARGGVPHEPVGAQVARRDHSATTGGPLDVRPGAAGCRDALPRSLAIRALAVSFAFVLCFAATARAAPTVTAVGQAVPILGFPHTGNILGAGAAVHAQVKISGSEYGGFPPPLIGITVDLPVGVKLDPRDFPSCPAAVILDEREPRKCPKGSSAGPPGKAFGVVEFGSERVPETTEILSFYAPGGGLEFLVLGHSPVALEVPVSSRLEPAGTSPGFGPVFTGEVPLIQTVPGAPDASAQAIEITLGTAIRKHGKAYYYGRVPKSCPKGGFRVRSEFVFAEEGDPERPEPVVVPFRAPCPRK